MRRVPSGALVFCVAVTTAVAACATSPHFVGATGSGGRGDASATASSSASGGQGGAGTTASSTGSQGGASSATATTGHGGASSAGHGSASATTATVGSGGSGTTSSGSGMSDAGVDCVAGAACTIDLSQCSASQEAPAWQGLITVPGTLELDFYTTHKGWMCQAPAVGEGWPIIPEPGWWCGTATPLCGCSPADQCH